MLTLSVLTVVVGIATISSALSINENGYYSTKYNHFDVERILSNKRLVMYYGQCLLGKGPCTPQGTEFKRILPEALHSNCVRCTEKQKITAYLAIRRLKKEYPKIWQQLQSAWDPTGEYVSAFINTVETTTVSTGAKITPTVIITRFGSESDNEIDEEAPVTVPLPKGIYPPASLPSLSSSTIRTTTQATTSTTRASSTTETLTYAPKILPSTAEPSTTTPEATTRITTSESTVKIVTSTAESVASTVKVPTSTAEIYGTNIWTDSPGIDTNYRTSFRPNRFNIPLPHPHEIGKLTANVIGSIGDLGTKVIRTGARIADMVLTGVQAGVQATIRIGRPLQ